MKRQNKIAYSFLPDSKPNTSYWRYAWKRLSKNKVAMVSLLFIITLFLFAFIGPLFFESDYTTQIRGNENLLPSLQYPFGTDNLGHDLLVRSMFATRVSLTVGVLASMIVMVIGTAYGTISGYFGGYLDDVMMRIVEFIYSMPDILVVLLLSTVLKAPLTNWFNMNQSELVKGLSTLGADLISIFIAFGLLYWVGMARIIRGQVLILKEQEFVKAAKALGASDFRIIRKHLIPNCTGQIIAMTCLQIPSAIFLESFLSFLGLGVSAPMVSLGSMTSDALKGMYTYTYRLIIPSFILSALILSLNLLGDALRDALDPHLKE